VHLCCGVFGTICIGLFAKEGVTTLSTVNGLFYGGGLAQLGKQLIGIAAVGAFVFAASSIVWLALKKTVGIRVTLREELEGLDIGEHGNVAYPDFALAAPAGGTPDDGGAVAAAPEAATPREEAIPVETRAVAGAKLTKVTVIANQNRYARLQAALDELGITGITVTNVLGYGMQKGHVEYYRGAPVEARLLPKVQIDVVIAKIPAETLVETVRNALYTGSVGDGKIFLYDVENVVKVRTGERGYDALQDS
jgi:Amt family ammonium transporter